MRVQIGQIWQDSRGDKARITKRLGRGLYELRNIKNKVLIARSTFCIKRYFIYVSKGKLNIRDFSRSI